MAGDPTKRKGHSDKESRPTIRRSADEPRPFVKTTPSADAARNAAERRWVQAFNDRYLQSTALYARMSDALTPDLQKQITDAELHRPGSGLAIIIDKIEPDVAARDWDPST